MIFAFNISRYVKSNSIVMVKNQRTLAIGAGQMSRIDSTNIARQKAKKEKISLRGCVMASEAFSHLEIMWTWLRRLGLVPSFSPVDQLMMKI